MLITSFASCLETWNVIWEMRFRFILCLKLFKTIRSRDHAWSSHRQFFIFFFWSSSLAFDEWHAHSRLSSNVCLFSICRTTFMMRRRLWNISSNLRKTTHQTWRKRLIKIWREQRHLIKLDDNVISSNLRSSSHQTFEKTDDFSTFDERSHVATRDMRNLVLQKITFFCVRLLW
jgi:hypothetical protein